MKIFINGHPFGYEMQRVTQMFFPGESVEVVQGEPQDSHTADFFAAVRREDRLYVWGRMGTDLECREAPAPQDHTEQERLLGGMIYKMASEATGIRPPWGVLTGIRPVKLFHSRMNPPYSMDKAQLERYFMEDCLLGRERFDLALQTAEVQQKLLCRTTPDSFSLYVSIPFCPTRCAYCSFVSHSIAQAAKLIPDYLDRLCDELADTASIAKQLGLRLRTVYFGGGTPTVLSAQQLKRLMDTIAREFDLSDLWEYTVEAGRPDTITAEKLQVIKQAGADRISINPQTLNDEVLQGIGRSHTTAQLMEAFHLARQCGFDNINMDLIAGLPGDDFAGFCRSIEGVIALSPENITVHTLTVKRGADVTFAQAAAQFALAGQMVDTARKQTAEHGYQPYYLYRQNGSLGALENVGYTKPNFAGLYNAFIMEEVQTILAVGAGASTKLRHPVTGGLKRIYNYKYPYEYINRFDVVRERKQQIQEFFHGIGNHTENGENSCKV